MLLYALYLLYHSYTQTAPFAVFCHAIYKANMKRYCIGNQIKVSQPFDY